MVLICQRSPIGSGNKRKIRNKKEEIKNHKDVQKGNKKEESKIKMIKYKKL